MDLAPGQLLLHYRLLSPIGAGGMGVVWKARDTKLNRDVALKFLPAESAQDPERRAMFLNEAQAASSLNDPGVVQVHALEHAGERDFIVMEFVEGEPLNRRIARGALPPAEAIKLGRQLARTLAKAHARGLVHRDIKPANLVLTADHDLKVVDFGLAALFEPHAPETDSRAPTAAPDPSATVSMWKSRRPGTTPTGGTLAYMSPDRLLTGAAGDRSDVYSMGVVLYEALAGKHPFAARTETELVSRILEAKPAPLEDLVTGLPPGIATVVARCLGATPGATTPRAAEVERELARIAKGIEDGEAPPAPAGNRTRRRAAPFIALGATAAVAASVILLLLWWPWSQAAGKTSSAGQRYAVLAEFGGSASDPYLARSVRAMVDAALQRSATLAVVPESQLQAALELAGLPDSTPIRAPLARQLAERGAIGLVVEGSVDRLGRRLLVTARLLAAQDGRVLASSVQKADDENGLIEAVSKVARELSGKVPRGLGTAPERFNPVVVTPSFAAFREFVRGRDLHRHSGDLRAAAGAYSAATALDPRFALAWMEMTKAVADLGLRDSARACLGRALAARDRLLEPDRLHLDAMIEMDRGDIPAMIAACRRRSAVVGENALDASWIGMGLDELGRFEECYREMRRAARLSPIGPGIAVHINLAWSALASGNTEAASPYIAQLQGYWRPFFELGLELARGRFATAESLARVYDGDATQFPQARSLAASVLAAESAVRGRVTQADADLGRAAATARAAEQYDMFYEHTRARALLALVAGRAPRAKPDEVFHGDSSVAALGTQAFLSALSGDAATAMRVVGRLEDAPQSELDRDAAAPRLARAELLARAGDWRGVVDLLAPGGRQRLRERSGETTLGRAALRWMLGDAWERLGRPDSAAAYFELALDHGRIYPEFIPAIRMISTFARLRLAGACAAAGHAEDARRHLAEAERACSDPDPDVKALMIRVRRAVARTDGAIGRVGRSPSDRAAAGG